MDVGFIRHGCISFCCGTYLGPRMNKQAVSELQYLADNITLQDLQMMHIAGGINSVHQFVQMMIDARIQYLQQQEQAA